MREIANFNAGTDGIFSKKDLKKGQYILDYIEKEMLRGNKITAFTICNALEAWDGGAGEL